MWWVDFGWGACFGYSSPGTSCLHTLGAETLWDLGSLSKGDMKQRMQWHKGAVVLFCRNQCRNESKDGTTQWWCGSAP